MKSIRLIDRHGFHWSFGLCLGFTKLFAEDCTINSDVDKNVTYFVNWTVLHLVTLIPIIVLNSCYFFN